jgi:hypothetical protein
VVEKSEAVETCTEYEAAQAVVSQESIGVVIISTAPLTGKDKTGAPTTIVVNLQIEDHEPAPL